MVPMNYPNNQSAVGSVCHSVLSLKLKLCPFVSRLLRFVLLTVSKELLLKKKKSSCCSSIGPFKEIGDLDM